MMDVEREHRIHLPASVHGAARGPPFFLSTHLQYPSHKLEEPGTDIERHPSTILGILISPQDLRKTYFVIKARSIIRMRTASPTVYAYRETAKGYPDGRQIA